MPLKESGGGFERCDFFTSSFIIKTSRAIAFIAYSVLACPKSHSIRRETMQALLLSRVRKGLSRTNCIQGDNEQ